MSEARIYRPAKTAMQSGRAKTDRWVLEFAPATAKRRDPLMGWIGSPDTRSQVVLRFATKEDAVAFAKKNGLHYSVQEPRASTVRPKSYADNFR